MGSEMSIRDSSRTGKPLFDSDIEAWTYGPVVPDVYHKYKGYGDEAIRAADDDFNPNLINGEELETLLDVMREYGQYTGAALVNRTHAEGTPWSNAKEADELIISTDSIMRYFKDHPIHRQKLNSELLDKFPNDWYDSSEDDEWETYL